MTKSKRAIHQSADTRSVEDTEFKKPFWGQPINLMGLIFGLLLLGTALWQFLHGSWGEMEEPVFIAMPDQMKVAADELEAGTRTVIQIKDGVEIAMRWVPPGTFLMGSPPDELGRDHTETQHKVTLTQGYWLAETETSQNVWRTISGGNPSKFKGGNLPVESVSWDDVQAFIQQLNARSDINFRLPTEAEWEYACRAGTTTPYHFGDQISPDQVNFDGRAAYGSNEKNRYREKTVPVDHLPGNTWGLQQMHGNVLEWCQDWYGPYPDGHAVDPSGPSKGQDRVWRGGGWFDDASTCRSAVRLGGEPSKHNRVTGFRLAARAH